MYGVERGTSYYTGQDGTRVRDDYVHKSILLYPTAKEGDTFEIPSGVDHIDSAFGNAMYLKTLIVPVTVKSVDQYTFDNDIENFYIPSSVKIPAYMTLVWKKDPNTGKTATIYGASGSDIEKEAKSNGINFIVTPDPARKPIVAPFNFGDEIETCEGTGDHSYGSYTVTKEATALAAGVKTRTCAICGHEDTRSISKLKATAKVNATSIVLKVKQSATAWKITDLASGDKVKSYKSKNTKIAAVTSEGKITGKKKGTTTITATLASGKKVTLKVKVQSGTVKTTKVTLKAKKITLKKGKTYQLTTTLAPITSEQKVTYTTSKRSVATVSSKGEITAKKKGTAVITVRSGIKKATCKVTVK